MNGETCTWSKVSDNVMDITAPRLTNPSVLSQVFLYSICETSPVKMSKTSPSVEKVLGCGRFQGLAFVCYQWIVCLQAWNMVFMVFGKASPRTWSYSNSANTTNHTGVDSCSCLPDNCGNFTWSGDFYSLVPHFQLVCDKVKIVYFLITIQMLGVLIGSPIFGQISDSFGRRWTLLSAVSTMILFGTLSALSPNWRVFAGLRFIVGMGCGGTTTTVMVLLMEMLNRKHRLWVSSVAGWPVAYVMLTLLAYLMPDWRTIAIVTNLAGLPALGLILFVGESPRWLLQNGKSELAEAQLRRIARMNRSKLTEKEMVDVMLEAAPGEALLGNSPVAAKKYSYWHLFSSKSMGVRTLVFAVCHFSTSTISNGVMFNIDKLSGNLFLNFLILACVRWIMNCAVVVADLSIKKFGRKFGIILPFTLIIVASGTVIILYTTGQNIPNIRGIISILSLSIAVICSPIWVIMHLSAGENYPTPIRNISAAFFATATRTGSVIIPQFLYLGHFWAPAPFVVFTTFSTIATLLFGLFIPETKGKPLSDTMAEVMNSDSSIQCKKALQQ